MRGNSLADATLKLFSLAKNDTIWSREIERCGVLYFLPRFETSFPLKLFTMKWENTVNKRHRFPIDIPKSQYKLHGSFFNRLQIICTDLRFCHHGSPAPFYLQVKIAADLWHVWLVLRCRHLLNFWGRILSQDFEAALLSFPTINFSNFEKIFYSPHFLIPTFIKIRMKGEKSNSFLFCLPTHSYIFEFRTFELFQVFTLLLYFVLYFLVSSFTRIK